MEKKKNKGKIIKRVIIVICVWQMIQIPLLGYLFSYGPFSFLGNIKKAKKEGNSSIYDFSSLAEMEDSPIAGKEVCFLGSSVTYGSASMGQSVPEYFAVRMGCISTKEAVSGTTHVDEGNKSYIQRLIHNVDKDAEYSLLICQLSTNDASKKKELGTIAEGRELEDFDTKTITGALEYIICYAQETWNCPVVFFTGSHYDSMEYEAMVQRLYELREKWDIGIIDLWTDEGFNEITEDERELYMDDWIHPTKAGYSIWWGPEMEKQLCDYLTSKVIR